MIKFFRQIRRALLSEGNTSPNDSVGRASKYFKYAIGEILLVVIGILIALQINNWNNNRKDAKVEQQYLSRLINELNDEIADFENLGEGFSKQNESVIKLLDIWEDDQFIIKDTAQFWTDFFRGSGPGPWYKEPVIWAQLVSSGELKLIRDQKVVEALFEHYGEVKRTADNFNEYPTQTTNEARKLIATSFAKTDFLLNPRNRRTSTPPAEALESLYENKDEFRVIFVRVGIIARIHSAWMETLKESAERTKAILEQDLQR